MTPPKPSSRPLANHIILILDEDIGFVRALTERLREEGAHVRCAMSVREAVWVLLDSPFLVDGLVCDADLADQQALDLMRVMRSDRTKPLRAVAVAHHLDDEVSQRLQRAGFDDARSGKDLESLVTALRQLLEGT